MEIFMPVVDTRGHQQSRVEKGKWKPDKCRWQTSLHHHIQNGPTYKQKFMGAFVAKRKLLIQDCAFICSLETLEGM